MKKTKKQVFELIRKLDYDIYEINYKSEKRT